MARDPYSALPLEGPDETALGTAFITLVEPHPGHERAYNRWYEDDHFYSGAMVFPWWFAGRRWVATRALRDLRVADGAPLFEPLDAGCYLATYWITKGRHADQWRWLGATVSRLREEGRMFADRTHVHTAYYDLLGCRTTGPRELHALDHPFAGLVLDVVDAETGRSRGELERWLAEEHAPALLEAGTAALCVWFAPHPRPPAEELWFDTPEADPRRLLVLWFLAYDPRARWAGFDAGAYAGAGTLRLRAPFIPTAVGTDRYVDELR
jgi:hypothetical protein